MLLMAATEHDIELKQSWMIGDQITDVQAGIGAGTKTGLILADPNKGTSHKETPDITRNSLLEIAQEICLK